MSWLDTDPMEQKIGFIKRVLQAKGGEFAQVCRQYGISRKTGYKWRQRYEQAGGRLSALQEHSRRPHRSPGRIARELEEQILELRQPDGWGARKIAFLLEEKGLKVSVATVHRTLLRHQQVHRLDQHSPALRRFEREQPNDLFQADFKGPMGRTGARDEPLTVLDDHSRYGLGIFALRQHDCQSVQDCFIKVFQRYGKPRQMALDHGTPWWNCRNGWGLSRLSVFFIEQDIELIFGRVAHPQTRGKIERFHRTLSRSMTKQAFPQQWEQWQERYDAFLERYNQVRPHEALAMKRPAERYRNSQRVYEPQVQPWPYSADLEMLRVDANGMIRLDTQRYFVCEALVHRQVGVERIGRQALVRFRNMYLRQIDLDSGTTSAFIVPTSQLDT